MRETWSAGASPKRATVAPELSLVGSLEMAVEEALACFGAVVCAVLVVLSWACGFWLPKNLALGLWEWW